MAFSQDYRIKTLKLVIGQNGVVNKKYYFPLDPEIDNGLVCGMIVVPGDDVTLSSSFTFDGLSVTPLSVTALKGTFITLVDCHENEKYKNLVPYTFIPEFNKGIVRTFMNMKVSTQKCYLTFLDVSQVTVKSYILIQLLVRDYVRQ
jgi:hypothetical protein